MMVKQVIYDIPRHYPEITVDHAVIMPNHIHLLLQIKTDIDGRPMAAPTNMFGRQRKNTGFISGDPSGTRFAFSPAGAGEN